MQSNEFNQFLDGVRRTAEGVAPCCWRAGEDFMATLFLERSDGSCCFSLIDDHHMSSPEAKSCWCLLHLPAILQAESAQRYAIVSEAWTVKLHAREGLAAWLAEGHKSLIVHPARAEVLMIACFDRVDRIVLQNEIKRVGKRRQRRRLSGWRAGWEGGDVGGLFTLGIAALKAA